MRVAILTACQDQVAAGYAHDLARMTAKHPDVKLLQSRGTLLPQQRAALVNAALKLNYTHTLWIDSDMRFPADSLERLTRHGKPIVAANYATRRPPITSIAPPSLNTVDGLSEVTFAGMGLMLVDCEVYRTIGEPYFALGFNPKDNSYIGEDFYFCKKARDKGYQVLIDEGLSREVRHLGEVEFKYEDMNIVA